MKRKIKLASVILLMLSLLIVPLCTHADFGDFAGDSDYGDSSWDDDDDYSWDDDDDRNERRNSQSDDVEIINLSGIVGIIIFSLLVLAIIGSLIANAVTKAKRKKDPYFMIRSRRQKDESRTLQPPSEALRPMTEFDQIDPSFSAADLQKKIADLYVRFQKSWQAKDISDLHEFLTDGYFAQMDIQLNNYRNKHQTNCIEDIKVISVQLKGWRKDGHNIEIVAKLDTQIVDYVIDDATGNIVRGSRDEIKLMRYEWTLRSDPAIRSSRQSAGTVKKACPNCGAELTINHSGTCPYCGSLVTSDSFDWAVCNIKGISQRTKKK